MIVLLTNVPVPALTLYFAVNVVVPAVSPVRKKVALPCMRMAWFGFLTMSACASVAGCVVAPEMAKPM
jgi:hypothetical protein